MFLPSALYQSQIIMNLFSFYCGQDEHRIGTSDATDSRWTMDYAQFRADTPVVPLPSLIILIATAASLLSSRSTTSVSYFSNSATVEAAAKCEC
jgi:hypothetical protein